MGDIVEPLGAEFKLPLPLLYQHNSAEPIGTVTFAKPTKNGIPFKATIARAGVAEFIDEAWALIKEGLIRGVSIGFRPLEYEPIDPKEPYGALRFTSWEWLELSAVTIPANQDATISSIKSLDMAAPPATGNPRAPVVRLGPSVPASGTSSKTSPDKGTKMKISERIASFEAKREELRAKRAALMEAADEKGETLDKEASEEFEAAGLEMKACDEHITRLREMEVEQKAGAKPVAEDRGEEGAQGGAGKTPRIVLGAKKEEPGIGFAKLFMALARAKGNPTVAKMMAKEAFRDDARIGNILEAVEKEGSMSSFVQKTAVAAGTTTDSTWASPIAQANVLASEFVEYMRPQTIIGKFGTNGIPDFRRVPFNVKIPRQTGGTLGTFVGEGLSKPVGKLAFDTLTMPFAKVATIVVLTEELVRLSDPSAQALARDDMAAGIAQYLDKRFIDPAYAAVANVSPASITNGASGAASTGKTVSAIDTDVKGAIAHYAADPTLNLGGLVWIMNPAKAISLSMLRNTDGSKAYPDITATGGTLMGYPVITSNNVALSGSPTDSFVVLVDPSNILMADDRQVSVDVSNEASLQMVDNPSAGAQSLVSLWQNNLIGLRAERYIYWMKRQTGAVYVITDTDW
jgi:HK97 family phage major capsid protein/HK97 family phage prohead protease